MQVPTPSEVIVASSDLELQKLFAGEVAERAARLAEGAQSLAAGELDAELAREMVREGHTIKGTARMMGYTALSDAGKGIEDAWRALADGEVDPSDDVAGALRTLAEELSGAVGADPASGTPGLASGLRALRRALHQEEPDDEGAEPPRPARESGDLGGLVGAIDSWALGESVRVNAAELFRLINEICSIRVDAEALAATVTDISRSRSDDDGYAEALMRLQNLVGGAEKALLDLQTRAVDLSAASLSEITNTFPQLVRYIARRADKEVRFTIVGDAHAVDRQVLERLSDPLRHLVVNAVQHGIETAEERRAAGKPPTASLDLIAEVQENRLSIVIEDDGRGIDWAKVRKTALERSLITAEEAQDRDALMAVLFQENFSTSQPSEMVGDGQGMATAAAAVEALHGTIFLETEPGSGTKITIKVPTSRALQDILLISSAGQTWGIPSIAVLDRIDVPSIDTWDLGGRAEVSWQGSSLPTLSFADAVGLRDTAPATRMVVVSTAAGPVAFEVERVLERRQVAARELGPILDGVPHLTGAALLGGGDVVVLVDPSRLAERARVARTAAGPRRRVLVIDDSRGARQVVAGALGSAGFEVDLASSPTEALSVLAELEFDAIVMDYLLPTMDGATLAGRVRELGITAPIVMLSGVATREDQERALSAGANAYLDKDDIRQGALADAIKDLILAA